ncbi:T9SS type A sorting domain-containing protein [Nonlabens sp. Hel1_33_55]|uniref:T9SS type A sorting domain-containing protein n=1 Tax=Nonlabens sp. Hel1_33_55 TaxID=1336802 RepID=UPI0012FDF475|nr:T9SS type A sorting domain-containing protein [Nonlabens sp. Hel1_33_55]
MRNFTFLMLLLMCSAFAKAQINYYVSQENGSNVNNGLTAATPFKNIDDATDIAGPGDTIFLMGEFTNRSYYPNYSYSGDINDPHLWHQENTVRINELNGSASGYITITSFDENTVLKGDGANILRITNSSYLRITDLKITGEVENIPLSTAEALQFLYREENSNNSLYRVQPGTSDEEIGNMSFPELNNVSRPSYTDTRGLFFSNVHHVDILRNSITLVPGNGLRVANCDYINIKDNEVANTSRKSYSGTHGLVVTKADSGNDTSDDYRIFIERNTIHHNYNEIYSWAPDKTVITPLIDEGKGISLQRNDIDDNGTPNNPNDDTGWTHGRILIANNLCYFNGFSGVHSNAGTRIDMINNTCYFNSYTKSIYLNEPSDNGGNIGISIQGGSDFKIINNISIIDSEQNKSAIAINADDVLIKDNIIYGTNGPIDTNAATVEVEQNTRMVDPMFTDPENFDFTLQSDSPALDTADPAFAPEDDFNQFSRDETPDLGALEFGTTAGIEEIERVIAVYPNPATDFIKWRSVNPVEQVALYNLAGQQLNVKRSNNSIDVSNLSTGMYVLVVDGTTRSIIKQ